MMIRKTCLYFFLFITSSSCIDPIEITLGEEPILIIDGILTDQPGPHIVNLSYSTGFNKNALFVTTREEVKNASVEIVDDQGNREMLYDLGNGKYTTSEVFKGHVGRSYHLEVVLSNEKGYVSLPEALLPVPEIQNGSFEKRTAERVTEGSIGFEEKVYFKIDFEDDASSANFYRWRYRGTYQVFAPLGGSPEPCIVACPGGPCWETIADCWATAFDFQFLKIAGDDLFDGKLVVGMEVYSTDVDRQFNIGYSSLIEQHSLTQRAFDYWNAIENQIGNNGTIFESANFRITGNIRSVDHPNEFVIGYFGASAVASARIFVSKSDVGKTPGDISCSGRCIPPECIDCRQWPASAVKPSFWPN